MAILAPRHVFRISNSIVICILITLKNNFVKKYFCELIMILRIIKMDAIHNALKFEKKLKKLLLLNVIYDRINN
jgi:hypothetical protein